MEVQRSATSYVSIGLGEGGLSIPIHAFQWLWGPRSSTSVVVPCFWPGSVGAGGRPRVSHWARDSRNQAFSIGSGSRGPGHQAFPNGSGGQDQIKQTISHGFRRRNSKAKTCFPMVLREPQRPPPALGGEVQKAPCAVLCFRRAGKTTRFHMLRWSA